MVRLVTLAIALLGLLLALLARRRARLGTLGLDDVALVAALHLAWVGIVATLLAWAGWFGPLSLGAALGGSALAVWPWSVERARGHTLEPGHALEQSRADERERGLAFTLAMLLIIGLGVGLRAPSIPAPLAGRDQGTYSLRAELTARTGTLGWTDTLLEQAGVDRREGVRDPGPEDRLGLYPKSDEPWRQGHYEAAYRPGAYLADRDRGEVVPQFMHLFPLLLACERLLDGSSPPGWLLMPWLATLWLLLLAGCSRWLWSRGPWPLLVVGLIACSPLAIWTNRTPLSESAMAVLEWAAVLLAVRLRAGVEPPRSEWLLAGLLASSAWVRGNALICLPLVLALLWLRPRDATHPRASLGLLVGLLAAIVVHALTVYPYLHDELLRRVPDLRLGPLELIVLAGAAALAWLLVDVSLGWALARGERVRRARDWLLARAPMLFVLVGGLALAAWWYWKQAAEQPKPFSRLDAAPILLGWPLLAIAGVGALIVAWRARPTPHEVWLVALASVIPTTLLFYAPRNLPSLGLFYYGRYLVPELLPVAVLLATWAIATIVQALIRRGTPLHRSAAAVLGSGLAALLAWSVAGPLVTSSQLRLREFEAAERAVDWLAERIPDDAVVIAGGEGWHHGHTYNQVGGALAMREGVQVLPYRTREDAWASAWELLVAAPERGQPARPVLLLVNEASHHYTRSDGARVAMIDDLLWAPFVVERASLLELFVHALTPVDDATPTRIARHELRMGLLTLAVDPAALAAIERIKLDDAPLGARVSGGAFDDGRACLDPDRSLRIELPPSNDPDIARHLVLIAAPGTPEHNPAWQVSIDGEPLVLEPPPGLRPHARATLGPYPIAARPRLVEIRAPALPPERQLDGACRFGELLELRLLPSERSSLAALAPGEIEARTIVPRDDHGHPPQPTTWVSGRALSRYRPGIELYESETSNAPRIPEPSGETLLLPGGARLEFPAIDLPLDERGEPRPLDLVVTLATTTTAADARLRVLSLDDAGNTTELTSIAPPITRTGSWTSPPQSWQPVHARARITVVLDASPDQQVALRDIALFTQTPEWPSTIAD